MTDYHAIETTYAGCRFRSRLEARWAVFFDTKRWSWEHEPEGIAIDGGAYLPDFRVWGHGHSAVDPLGYWYFEIKPQPVVEAAWDIGRDGPVFFAPGHSAHAPLAKPAEFARTVGPIWVVGELAHDACLVELAKVASGRVGVFSYRYDQDWLIDPSALERARSYRFGSERPQDPRWP